MADPKFRSIGIILQNGALAIEVSFGEEMTCNVCMNDKNLSMISVANALDCLSMMIRNSAINRTERSATA